MAKAKKTETAAIITADADLITPAAAFELIPLDLLAVARENARYGKGQGDVKALAASIRAAGRIIQPLNVYRDARGEPPIARVWEGGRRLAALQLLAAEKAGLPAALQAGIPCLVDPDASRAQLQSMASFVRDQMHPADEFLAYKELVDKGLDHAGFAAACAVPTPRVRQLLRLVGIAPEVFEAFKAGKLALDVVEAFTVTDDPAKQAAVLASFKGKTPGAYQVRAALKSGSVGAMDSLALFVGREAYKAAGGHFLHDLFSHGDNEDFADGDLLRRLADEKLNGIAAELLEEGWGAVERSERDQHYRWNYDKLDQRKGPWSATAMAEGRVFIGIDYNGKAEVRKGYFPKPKAAAGSAAATPAKKDPARYGFGHSGHAKMTVVATEATKVALVRNPAAAYDATLTHLAWSAFRVGRYASVTDQSASALEPTRNSYGVLPSMTVEGQDEVDHAKSAWDARLPKSRVAFCEYVAALPDADKAALLAISFASTLQGAEAKMDMMRPTRWAHLGWMAKHAGLDIAKAWTPDAKFLKGASKDALLQALDELTTKGAATTSGWQNAKKSELVTMVLIKAADRGWTPKLLATLTDVRAKEEAPSASSEGDDEAFEDDTLGAGGEGFDDAFDADDGEV